MFLTYEIRNIDKYHNTCTTDIYQTWIAVSGSIRIESEGQNYIIRQFEAINIPAGKSINFYCEDSTTIAVINIHDFLSTCKKIIVLTGTQADFIYRLFNYAYEILQTDISSFRGVMPNLDYAMLYLMLTAVPGDVNPHVLKLINEIRDNYFYPDYDINLESSECCYSESHMRKIFREETGISPQEFLLQMRLEQAKKLLRERPDQSIKQVAFNSGFSDAYYFSRVFKKKVGMTPSEYITRARV